MDNCLVCHSTLRRFIRFPNNRAVWKCPQCRLRALRPQPSSEELNHYYNRADYYDKELNELHKDLVCGYDEQAPLIKMYKRHVDRMVRVKNAPAKLLEIGCSRGVFLDLCRKRGYDAHGMDMSEEAAAYAREKFQLDVIRAGIENAAWDNNSFDVVAAFDVLEHLSQPRQLIQRAAQWLKPGGMLVIGTPNSDSLICRLAETLSVWSRNKFCYSALRFYGRGIEHLHIFNPSNLEVLMDQFHFRVIDRSSYNIPVRNMCDLNVIQRLTLSALTLNPYEFVLIAELAK